MSGRRATWIERAWVLAGALGLVGIDCNDLLGVRRPLTFPPLELARRWSLWRSGGTRWFLRFHIRMLRLAASGALHSERMAP